MQVRIWFCALLQELGAFVIAKLPGVVNCSANRTAVECQDGSNLKRPLGKEPGWHMAAGAGEVLGQCSGKGGKEKLSLLSCSWQRDDHTADHRYDVSGFVPSNLNRLILV